VTLHDYLRKNHISQNNFARLANLSQSVVSRIVRQQAANSGDRFAHSSASAESMHRLEHEFSAATGEKIAAATGGRVRL
jgi:predicted transcriptional regulator